MDFNERLEAFQDQIAGKVDLVFFPLSADLHYLTGVPRDIPNFGAVLHPGGWLEGLWLAPEYDPVLILPRMSAEYGGLEKVHDLTLRILPDHEAPPAFLRGILNAFKLPNKPRLALGDSARAETVVALQAMFPQAKFSSATALLNPLRRVKSAEELALLQKAGQITEAAFGAMLDQLQAGITELEIIQELEFQLRWHGAFCPSFTTSLYCSGPNHPLIFGERQAKSYRELQPPVAILFDFGAVYEGYCYDYGRTVSLGEPSAEFLRHFQAVMAAQAVGIAQLKAGATAESVDRAARAVLEAEGLGEAFRHRLGHGIGLDVHEAPFLTQGDSTLLEVGMTFTVEPSVMFKTGFSARVEDVVVVGEAGGQALTRGFQTLHIVA